MQLARYGARDRGRTDTVFPPRDFKSLASTNFATRAEAVILLCDQLNRNKKQQKTAP